MHCALHVYYMNEELVYYFQLGNWLSFFSKDKLIFGPCILTCKKLLSHLKCPWKCMKYSNMSLAWQCSMNMDPQYCAEMWLLSDDQNGT